MHLYFHQLQLQLSHTSPEVICTTMSPRRAQAWLTCQTAISRVRVAARFRAKPTLHFVGWFQLRKPRRREGAQHIAVGLSCFNIFRPLLIAEVILYLLTKQYRTAPRKAYCDTCCPASHLPYITYS